MTAGRNKKSVPPELLDAPADEAQTAQGLALLRAEGMGVLARTEAARQLAERLAYAGSLAPDALEDGIVAGQQRINLELFDMGSRLLLLREQCEHGDFLTRLERTGLQPRAAQRLMQATAKFGGLLAHSNASTSTHFASLGKSKVFELLVLDDEETVNLIETGSVRGIELDEMAQMSVSEMREALREAAAKQAAITEELEDVRARSTEKSQRIEAMHEERLRIKRLPPDQVLAELRTEATGILNECLGSINGALRQAFVAISGHHDIHGGTSKQLLAGHVAQLQQLLNGLREEFMLPDHVGDGTPEWMRATAGDDIGDPT